MKSMQIGSALIVYSSSRSPPTAVSSGQVSNVHVGKAVNTNLNTLQIRRLNCYYKHVTKIQRHQIRKTKFQANAASEASENATDHEAFRPQTNGKSLGATLGVIYKYTRAYTLKGTALAIISVSLLAVRNLSDFTPSFFIGALQVLVGGCLANLYTVGINQLSDIEIDKVNKPYLPLPSGELPVKTAILVTSLYAFLGTCLGLTVNSWPLKLGLFLWYAFATAYSVNIPLLRWKRIPALAAMCIWSVQAVIIPILFHLHVQTSINGGTSLLLSKHAVFVSGIMSIYGVVIALFKDVPDVEGDKINGVNSLASQLGQKQVFWICIWLLEMVYGVAIVIGLSSARMWIRIIMVIGHSILGFILWRNANLVDLESIEATESFYQFIWKLYSVEYLLVPILRF